MACLRNGDGDARSVHVCPDASGAQTASDRPMPSRAGRLGARPRLRCMTACMRAPRCPILPHPAPFSPCPALP